MPTAPLNLTQDEKDLLSKTADLWNSWCLLDDRKNHDDQEFQTAVHGLQHLIALRVARRVDPDIWA